LRLFLRDDVVVEDGVDVARARQVVEIELGRSRQLLVDDLVAEVDALVADVDPGAGDELLDLPLALAAEAAEQLLVPVARPRHWSCSTSESLSRLARCRSCRCRRSLNDHIVDDAVLLPFLRAHEVVAL